MSYISSGGTPLTTAEINTILSLTNLVVTPAGQAISKTGSTSFGNVTAGSATWHQSEVVTVSPADHRTFTLAFAPSSVIYLLGGHQPQVYGIDFTGTIDGSNKTFVYASAVDPSLLTDQYATYS